MAVTTRDKLIDAAHTMFYRDGFHGVGIDRILDQVGVTKTTFYNHFECKEDLMLAVLNRHDTWWRETFSRKLREFGGDTAKGQLLAAFDVVDELFHTDGFNGCIFINVSVEFPLLHDPVHQAAARHKAAMGEILRELASFAGAKDARALAEELSVVLEGTYVTQHISGDAAAAEVGRRVATGVVERHLAGG
jgi:AcrR family transcriptional regulator